MAEWLLEVLSEEMPSRMQQEAESQLKSLAETQLKELNLSFDTLSTFTTPRRLTLIVQGLPLEIPSRIEEKKGPLLTASEIAIEGFLRTVGGSRKECVIKNTPKGECLFVVKTIPSQPTRDLFSSLAVRLLREMHWPKSMCWGNEETPWVRPIRRLLSLFEKEIVKFAYAGVESSNVTQGHRFLSPDPFVVASFDEYQTELKKRFVVLNRQERRELIDTQVRKLAEKAGLALLEDKDLLDEVVGLVEWPISLKGTVDAEFMALPPEVITTPMRHHQRYFPFLTSTGEVASDFGIVTNTEVLDQGQTIVKGNERVLRARLADAKFFWEQDQKKPLGYFNVALKTRLFHQHLGTLFDKVERLVALTSRLGQEAGGDSSIVERAALLSKADLASQMVTEFPELQGIMGKYYALNQGESPDVAQAIEEHYWPIGAKGKIPEVMPSLILGIADRLDTLIGFFSIGITPTGSKDPYALKRAGFSLISLAIALPFQFSIREALSWAYDAYPWADLPAPLIKSKQEVLESVWKFLLERLKFFLKDKQGSPYDYVEAVLSVADENPSFYDLALRTRALDELMAGKEGKSLLVAYKRATHILDIEENKESKVYTGVVVSSHLGSLEEKVLFKELEAKAVETQALAEKSDFVSAIKGLATLRPFVDSFFDHVTVNVEEKTLRENRLQLLAFLRKILHQVVDFSKIEM